MQTRMQACVNGAAVIPLSRPASWAVATWTRGAWLALPLLVLAGCGTESGGSRSPVVSPAVPMPPPRQPDAVGQFIGSAAPGQQAVIAPTPGAAPVQVRMVRAYFAGSGRNCREAAIGGGAYARSAIYCEDPRQGWTETRALLRGGAVSRP